MVVNVVDAELPMMPRMLESVKWADEIVIVDMTTDGGEIEKIGKEFGAKVYKHKFVDYVEPVRNFSVSKVTSTWILIIDPDEEIPVSLARKLKRIVKKPKADYYRLPRKNIIFERWIEYSGWWPDYNIRFFKKGAVSWTETIHGVPITIGDGADLVAKESNAILHHNYQTIEQYLERMNRYTGRQAGNLMDGGYSFRWQDLIHKPVGEFVNRYFAGEGYKDGVHGLALAGLQSLSELVVFLKVWQRAKFTEDKLAVKMVMGEMKKAERELSYWQADSLVKNLPAGRQVERIMQRVKRKFKLR